MCYIRARDPTLPKPRPKLACTNHPTFRTSRRRVTLPKEPNGFRLCLSRDLKAARERRGAIRASNHEQDKHPTVFVINLCKTSPQDSFITILLYCNYFHCYYFMVSTTVWRWGNRPMRLVQVGRGPSVYLYGLPAAYRGGTAALNPI